MFYQVEEYKKNGEMVCKLFDNHRDKYAARYEALSYFEMAEKAAQSTFRILASDRALKNCSKDELETFYDDAVYKIELIKRGSSGADVVVRESTITSFQEKDANQDEFDEVDIDGRGIQSFGLRRSILKND